MSQPRWWIVAVLPLLLGGCGDDDDGASADSEVCAALEEIAALDDSFQAEVSELLAPVLEAAESGDAQAAQEAGDAMAAGMTQLVQASGQPLIDAYTQLEGLVPEDLADDVAVLREFTRDLLGQLAAAEPTLEGINAVFELADTLEGQEAVSANLAVDEYSREECDVTIAD